METTDVGGAKRERQRAIVLLAITAFLWSTGGLLIKLINWNPVAIAGMRSLIAALIILTVIRKPHISWSFNQVGGAVAYAATLILFVTASKMTTAANAILLQYTAPVYVALLGTWFLNEKVTRLDWVTIFAVIGGMVLFFFDHIETGGIIGNILAILCGVTFAGIALFMRKQKNESPLESIFLGNVLIAIFALPFMLKSMPDSKSWVGLIILGVVQIGIPYILYSVAIKHVTALEAVLIPVIEPIFNPVWVFLVVGEAPGPWAVIGGIIVLFFITARCTIVAIRAQRAVKRELSQEN